MCAAKKTALGRYRRLRRRSARACEYWVSVRRAWTEILLGLLDPLRTKAEGMVVMEEQAVGGCQEATGSILTLRWGWSP